MISEFEYSLCGGKSLEPSDEMALAHRSHYPQAHLPRQMHRRHPSLDARSVISIRRGSRASRSAVRVGFREAIRMNGINMLSCGVGVFWILATKAV